MKCDQSYPTYKPCAHLDYRGVSVDFWENIADCEIFTIWHGEYLGFGFANLCNFQDDMKLVIDQELDTVSKFDEFQNLIGCRLKWFKNGYARDLQLLHRNRILKVWVVTDESKVDLQKIIQEAREILLKLPDDFCK